MAHVIVSHRLSTLKYADKVLYLNAGELRTFVVHEELFEGNEAYRAFTREHLSAVFASRLLRDILDEEPWMNSSTRSA